MKINKLSFKYIKKINTYLIIGLNNKIIGQYLPLNNNNFIYHSKSLNTYNLFLKNLSLFGLFPTLNNKEF